jgi:hypothetical protein
MEPSNKRKDCALKVARLLRDKDVESFDTIYNFVIGQDKEQLNETLWDFFSTTISESYSANEKEFRDVYINAYVEFKRIHEFLFTYFHEAFKIVSKE